MMEYWNIGILGLYWIALNIIPFFQYSIIPGRLNFAGTS